MSALKTFKSPRGRTSGKQRVGGKAVAKASKISRKKGAMFITRSEVRASAEQLNDEQQAQLREARARAKAVVSKPSLSLDALRARVRRAAQWEKDHGVLSVFAGTRR
ncbi:MULTISPECIES: hypothetical protein [Burkholderia]|uniref:hypothetical protein n=1 Tax=Burkholderia TaxID=32008 RepID=UPI000A4EB416|nr:MULTISPECIES: hypothetical protein [Burkholderia]